MSVHVLAPGLRTTIQDCGRTGSRHLGVGCAGALDAHSHAIASLLVGNPVDAPTLEITISGPRLRFDRAACIAICGADIDVRADNVAIARWRRAWLPARTTLTLGNCRRGARAYLAVDGGFAAPRVLGSASTDLRGGFGGFDGRALAAGDILETASSNVRVETVDVASWWIDPTPDVDVASPAIIRVLPGSDPATPGDALFRQAWRVSATSDRQGLRLEGDAIALQDVRDRISEPLAPGTIQLPPSGQPIVLLADAQTHGGYARIGHAIHADWPRLAQLRPGESVHFVPTTHGQARMARIEQARRLARIGLAIASRIGA